MSFHGSYTSEDVEFLLQPYSTSEVETIDVGEKEHLIQSGRHYSEFFTFEKLPTAEYLTLFHRACNENRNIFARDLLYLAAIIHKQKPKGEILLISLARAGTPIGVLLKHVLQKHFQRTSRHYSISIIRDRGIDEAALNYILGQDGAIEKNITFIDGWTGKGVIGEELQKSIADYNVRQHRSLDSSLYVVADISGTAHFSATNADYLIPSAILNSTISGLVSRTILNDQLVGKNQFHACVYYKEYESNDLSRQFIFDTLSAVDSTAFIEIPTRDRDDKQRRLHKEELNRKSHDCINFFMDKYSISSRNFVKPGIGEATRVLLRRMAHLLILREKDNRATAHLRQLALEKNIPVAIDSTLPYQALALICDLQH